MARARLGRRAASLRLASAVGTYLQDLLRATLQTEAAKGSLVIVPDEAVAIVDGGARLGLRLALGHKLEVDQIVLATGNLPPHDPPGMDDGVRLSDAYIGDPWRPDAFGTLRPDDDVLLIGSGLTAIDMVLKLSRQSHRGRITALSRRGLKPRAHANGDPPSPAFDVPSRPSLTQLVRLVRRRAGTEDWHCAIDGLRPSTERLWREASADERRRFLRHLRPWWDVHRHRLAPSVAAAVSALEAAGQVTFRAGRIEAFRPVGERIEVSFRPRKRTNEIERLAVTRIINCTGPAGNLPMTRSPLLADLVRRGMARPDACGLGLEVDAECHIVGLDGIANPNILAVGPMSRGAFWEITAVPDIRVQALLLAERLSARCERESRAVAAN